MTPHTLCRLPQGRDVCCSAGEPQHGSSELDASSAYVITVLTNETAESDASAATCYDDAEDERPCYTRHERTLEPEPLLTDFVCYDDHGGWIRSSKQLDQMDYFQESRYAAQEERFHQERLPFHLKRPPGCSESYFRDSSEAYRAKEFYEIGGVMNAPFVLRENNSGNDYTSDWCDSADDQNRLNHSELCYSRSSCYSTSPESPSGPDREIGTVRSGHASADSEGNGRPKDFRVVRRPEARVYTDLDRQSRGSGDGEDFGHRKTTWKRHEGARCADAYCDVDGQAEETSYTHLNSKLWKTRPRLAKDMSGSFTPSQQVRDSKDLLLNAEEANFVDQSNARYISTNIQTQVYYDDEVSNADLDNGPGESNTTEQDNLRAYAAVCSGKANTAHREHHQEYIVDAPEHGGVDMDVLSTTESDITVETKSRDTACSINPVLPPCRICGAKASGFHYGVNSCEACKGFFRRALKRPMVFHCTKNKTCDVKGNKRSSCRFCRYKRCLKLGMSKEAIKTGRYSHRKRTKDTIEVKRLQQERGAVADASEMDAALSSIFIADRTRLKSTTATPGGDLLEKQMEYAAMYTERKKKLKYEARLLEMVNANGLSSFDSRLVTNGGSAGSFTHLAVAHNSDNYSNDYLLTNCVTNGKTQYITGHINEHEHIPLYMKDSQNISNAQAVLYSHDLKVPVRDTRKPMYYSGKCGVFDTVYPRENRLSNAGDLLEKNSGQRPVDGLGRSDETNDRDRSTYDRSLCDRTPCDPAPPSPSSRGETPGESQGSKTAVIAHAENWVMGYIGFARSLPGFSALSLQDQASLLRHAWDEVWILGAFSGYNKDLDVVTMPSGQCFHMEEMEKGWGKDYAHLAFSIAEIIKRHNLSPQLITLLKAVCIASPDRCELKTREDVENLHWTVVTCLLHHLQAHHPGDRGLLPRLVDILTSLREISEAAQHRQEDVAGATDLLSSSMLTNMFAPF